MGRKAFRNIEVINWRMDKGRRPAKNKAQHQRRARSLPNNRLAITEGYIATVENGKRLVRRYYSGEPLQGRIEN